MAVLIQCVWNSLKFTIQENMIIYFFSPRVENLGMYVQQWGKTFCLSI